MKVIIPGGSGQVGAILCRALTGDGHDVVIISRRPPSNQSPARFVSWDGRQIGEWAREFDGADVVINLAGRSVNCRYHTRNRREMIDSRVHTTSLVGQAIAQANRPPRLWFQASTATIYAHRYEAPNDERSGIIGGSEPDAPDAWRFSIEVAKAWEHTLEEANVPGTRKILMRSAMTMSPDPKGIFDTLLGLVRKGLGGTCGDGRQYVSWIHEYDFVRAVYWLIDHEALDGPINLAAPNPLPNSDFMRTLRRAWGTRIGMPATKWMLEVGAIFLRTETELILKSRRVIPTQLLESGFNFEYPAWPEAAADLCRRWREIHQPVTRTAAVRS